MAHLTMEAQCKSQAMYLAPNSVLYGIERVTIPDPIARALVPINDTHLFRDKSFCRAGALRTATLAAVIIATDEPKCK